jgi:hypothetical protein
MGLNDPWLLIRFWPWGLFNSSNPGQGFQGLFESADMVCPVKVEDIPLGLTPETSKKAGLKVYRK